MGLPKTIDLNSKVQKDFLNYANAVIKSRAISNVEDNLKPVHRRILFAMDELSLDANAKHKKSARVVGDVIGKYHPHGDTSAYDAMVRLSQPWKMRYPLIDMQGNNGNILGDGPAAMRYTEARLSKFGEFMLDGIDRNAVKFKLSYDEANMEPVILPSTFPNILCNGNSGIAVGLSASLVPHNLKEVVNAIVAYLNYKNITIVELMKYIPGPDFPTGATIIDTGKMKDIYSTGVGTITLRSKYAIENVGTQQHIVFTEIPYLVDVEDGIIEPLKKLVVEDKFELIEDFENNTDKNGVNLRIILKKGANVYKVLEALWQSTRLQITQRVNNTVILNGNPKTLDLKQLIASYIEHRHIVITNIATNDLDKTKNRKLIVEALLSALAKIDEVIALIKSAKDKSDARKKLMEFLKISDFQADGILDMKLSRLNQLDNVELKSELDELQKKEKELRDILTNVNIREEIMKKELLQMSAKYADNRRTTLIYNDVAEGETMPIQDVKVLFYSNGSTFVTQQKLADLDFKKKISPLNTSAVSLVSNTKTDRTLTVFTKDGSMSDIRVLTMTLESLEAATINGCPLAAFDFEDKKNLKEFIVFVTSGGLVKKTRTEEYIKSKNNTRTIKLKGDQDLIFVGMANNNDNIAILSDNLTFFKVDEITESSKLTIGSKGISGGIASAAAIVAENEKLLMMNNEGQGKLTKASDFVITSKGSNGQVIAENTILITKEANEYFVFDGAKNIYIDSNPLTKGKTAVGSKMITGKPLYISQ